MAKKPLVYLTKSQMEDIWNNRELGILKRLSASKIKSYNLSIAPRYTQYGKRITIKVFAENIDMAMIKAKKQYADNVDMERPPEDWSIWATGESRISDYVVL